MSRSQDRSLLSEHRAVQHKRAPRPLPLFLEMVRLVAERDPELGRAALDGLALYEQAERPQPMPPRPIAARAGPATLRDHGGTGPPVVLIPSLINPPNVLDLDSEVSLTSAIAGMRRHVLLLDWGQAHGRSELSVGGHVEELLLPLLRAIGDPAALVGYCLGGTMAIAAAQLAPAERVVTIAAPWHFDGYPNDAREALASLWRQARDAAEALGAMPMEMLQAAFWSLDPERTVAKFATFAELEPNSPEARRFVALEDWANEGEPLPCPAARELIEDFFGSNLPGSGRWSVAGQRIDPDLPVPLLNCTARHDRITPAATAPEGEAVQIAAGHVGMIVGSAREQLHRCLDGFLDPACR
jgi:poly[(R)-3-hydroxyalkanoate] polymerase subunit PhaC